MKRTFVYTRVSTAEQTEGDGFARQYAACKAFADKQGWSVTRTFKEQQSGADSAYDRPMLTEAMLLCASVGASTIIVERIDRIGRDLIVCELFFRSCKAQGISVYAADSGEELVNAEGDPTRKLIRQILGALAEWDKSQICCKLQAGRIRRVRETGMPCGGPVRFGHAKDLSAARKQRAALELIVSMRDIGRSPWSVIAQRLAEKGFVNPKGELRWSISTVHFIYSQSKKREQAALTIELEEANLTVMEPPTEIRSEELTDSPL